MKLEVRLLGNPTIGMDNKKVVIPLRKAEAIFYYLLLQGRVTREKLATLLWGDRDEESAHNNLRNSLYQIRKALPLDVLESDRRHVTLQEQHIHLDLWDLPKIGDFSFKSWHQLCGELLRGFEVPESEEFSTWLGLERTRVKEEILQGLKGRIVRAHEEENSQERRLALRTLLNLDPYDEDSCLELMELYAEEGSLSQALDLFASFRARISTDLNLVPSSRAEKFLQRITAQHVTQDTPIHQIRNFFFGRQRELEQTFRALSAPREKKLCLYIHGEAGVGKSTFIRHILEKGNAEDGLTFRAQGYEIGRENSLTPWNIFAEELASREDMGSLSIDPLKLSFLSATFPGLFKGRRITGTTDLSTLFTEPNPITVGQIFGEILSLIRTTKPLTLVLENLQWFDRVSLYLLEGLLRTLPQDTVIFASSRTKEGRKAFSFLQQHGSENLMDVLAIPLAPFSRDETYQFCSHFLMEENLEAQQNLIYQETQGIPLFLAEYIKAMHHKKNPGEGLWGIIASRCENLDEKERSFLELLSLFYRGATLEEMGHLGGEETLSLSPTAESLLSKGFIEEIAAPDGYDSLLSFHHEKVREYIYQSMPQFKRKELHKKVATFLEREHSPHIWNPRLSAQLYHHYERGGLKEKELELCLREMALHIILNHELFPLLRDKVLLSCSSPFSDRTDTEARLGQVRELLHKLNRQGPSNPALLRMEAAYLELRGGYLITWGSYKEGRHVINRALGLTDKHGFGDLGLHCLKDLCLHGVQTDNPLIIEPHAKNMLRQAKEMGKEHYLGVALRFLGVARQIRGDFDGAEKIYVKSIEFFEELQEVGRPYTLNLLAAWNYRGELHHWQGEFHKALECFEYCISRCEEEGFFWGLSLFHSNAASVALDIQDFDLMETHVDKAIDLFERCQGGRSGSMIYSLKAICDARRNRLPEALQALERGELLCAPIFKKSWASVQFLAKACLGEEMRKNPLAREMWAKLLPETGSHYAHKAGELLRELHQEKRLKVMRHNPLLPQGL